MRSVFAQARCQLPEEPQPGGLFHPTIGHRTVTRTVLVRNHRHGVRSVRKLSVQKRHDATTKTVDHRRQGKCTGYRQKGML